MTDKNTTPAPNNAIVVVTYHPTPDTLPYLQHLASHNLPLIIVDNTEETVVFSFIRQCKNIYLIKNEKNLGLATALNQGVKKAIELGCEFAFLFDQDSRIENDFFQEMLEFKTKLNRDDIIIYASDFVDTNTGTHAKFAKLNTWTWNNVTCESSRTENSILVNFAITSGSLLCLDKYKKIGRFRDDYFIDHIDSEYCLRAAKHNYYIIVNCAAVLNHTIGDRSIHRIFGLTIKPNHHNATRRYYIARNGINICVNYGRQWPAVVFLNITRIIHEIISILLYEKAKRTKLSGIIRGIIKGLKFE